MSEDGSGAKPPTRDLLLRIAGGTAVIVGILTFFGVQGDALESVVRNNGGATFAIFVLIFIAVGLAVVASAFHDSWPRPAQYAALVLAAVLFVSGTAWAVDVSVDSKAAKQRPWVNLTVSVTDGLATATYEARASGLTDEEALGLELEGLHSSQPVFAQIIGQVGSRVDHVEPPARKQDPNDPTEEFVSRLSYAFVGPDGNGDANFKGSIDIPLGVYERLRLTASVLADPRSGSPSVAVNVQRCDREATNRGCVAVALPPGPIRPQLVVRSSDEMVGELLIDVDVTGLSTTQVVDLVAWRNTESGTQTFGVWRIAPNGSGTIDATVDLLVEDDRSRICVQALLLTVMVEPPATTLAPEELVEPAVPGGGTDGDSQTVPAQAAPLPATSPGDAGAMGGPSAPRDCEDITANGTYAEIVVPAGYEPSGTQVPTSDLPSGSSPSTSTSAADVSADGGPAATSGEPGTTVSTGGGDPRRGLSLVVVGDSLLSSGPSVCSDCASFVESYATAIESESGLPVEVSYRNWVDGATSAEIARDLANGRLDDSLATADIVIVSLGTNDLPPYAAPRPCGYGELETDADLIAALADTTTECVDAVTAEERTNVNEVLELVSARARNARVGVLVPYDIWRGWVVLDETSPESADDVSEVVRYALHKWKSLLCAEAIGVGARCIDVYNDFNGPDGRTPSGSLLAEDYEHPSQLGGDRIRDLLIEAALHEPVPSPGAD